MLENSPNRSRLRAVLTSLATIVLISSVSIGATAAFFSDVETSRGNIFTAGSIDLKVNHNFSSYNDVSCELAIVSNTNDVVSETGDNAAATFVHPAWTADISGATWIWQPDPAPGATYTFTKTFNWDGPVGSATLDVAADNAYSASLNGSPVGADASANNFQTSTQDQYDVSLLIVQGTNTISIEVNNLGGPSNPPGNPAGLLYRLRILNADCNLWDPTNLTDEKFFQLEDLKPGDRGTEVISYTVEDNSAWACLYIDDVENDESGLVGPEDEDGDTTLDKGELSGQLQAFAWDDADGDGSFDPGDGEQSLTTVNSFFDVFFDIGLVEPPATPLQPGDTGYVGIAWCLGSMDVNGTTGEINCDGTLTDNTSQTDILAASLALYAEQSRNNPEFSCSGG